ncbi:MAG: hypothetical protein RL341_66, partial [Pseudomonadota bacterium]
MKMDRNKLSNEQKKLAWVFFTLLPLGVLGNLLVTAFAYKVFQPGISPRSNEFFIGLHPAFIHALVLVLLPMAETAGLLMIRELLLRKSQGAEFIDPLSR